MTKILVIDDDLSIRNSLKEILSILSFETIIAPDSATGIVLAKTDFPDLILCDIMMPNLNGYQVLKELKKNSLTANIPFIFLTAKSHFYEIREGMNMGADDYIIKPFTLKDLSTAINIRLEKKRTREIETEKKLVELRTNISSHLPHELYTPLNGIMGPAQLLAQLPEKLSVEKIAEMGKLIYSSAERLHNIIQNFVLYSELEIITNDQEKIAELKSKKEFCFPDYIILNSAEFISNKYNRNSDLILPIIDENICINISEYYFQIVVNQLIENAFKFSTPNSPIQISSHLDKMNYCFSIVDSGRGMTDEQIERIGGYMQFERKKYEQQGAGLGLTIARKIVELHDGHFMIESVIGEKTIVTINLSLYEEK